MKEPFNFKGKRAVSIQFMWSELSFPERVARAAQAGFNAVEMWDWRDKDIDAIAEAAHKHGVVITGFFGNRIAGLVDKEDHERNLQGLKESLEVAKRTGTPVIHLFTNEIKPGGKVTPNRREIPLEEQWENCLTGLKQCARLGEEYGVTLLLEAINPVFVPGYLLDTAEKCRLMTEQVGSPWVPMIYDFYHQQLSGGNLIEHFKRCQNVTRAVHIADVPGRHQPGTGEINYANISAVLEETGYDGMLTFEVTPKGSAEEAVKAIRTLFSDWF